MTERWFLELTKNTIEELTKLLRQDANSFAKENCIETDRVDKAKIEKSLAMLETLKFFMNKGLSPVNAEHIQSSRTLLND